MNGIKAGAAAHAIETSFRAISHRAASRIQLAWRAKAAALIFLDKCAEERFSARAFACDRMTQVVLRRFSHNALD